MATRRYGEPIFDVEPGPNPLSKHVKLKPQKDSGFVFNFDHLSPKGRKEHLKKLHDGRLKSKVPRIRAQEEARRKRIADERRKKREAVKPVTTTVGYLRALENAADLLHDLQQGQGPRLLDFADCVEEAIHELEQFAQWNEGPKE